MSALWRESWDGTVPLGPCEEAEEWGRGLFSSLGLWWGPWSWYIGSEFCVCPEVSEKVGAPGLYGGRKGRKPADCGGGGGRLGPSLRWGWGIPSPLLELQGRNLLQPCGPGCSRARTWRPLVAECRPCRRSPALAQRPHSTTQTWRGRAGAAPEGGVPAPLLGRDPSSRCCRCAAQTTSLCFSFPAYKVGLDAHGQGCWEGSIRESQGRPARRGRPQAPQFGMTRF